jgi:hypothetical protein
LSSRRAVVRGGEHSTLCAAHCTREEGGAGVHTG